MHTVELTKETTAQYKGGLVKLDSNKPESARCLTITDITHFGISHPFMILKVMYGESGGLLPSMHFEMKISKDRCVASVLDDGAMVLHRSDLKSTMLPRTHSTDALWEQFLMLSPPGVND